MSETFIIDVLRSPLRPAGGALAGLHPEALVGRVLEAMLDRHGLAPYEVDALYLGAGDTAGEQGRDLARLAALAGGLPVDCRAVRVGERSLADHEALHQGVMAIASGYQGLVLVAGVGSASRVQPGAVAQRSDAVDDRFSVLPEEVRRGLLERRLEVEPEALEARASLSRERAQQAGEDGAFDDMLVWLEGPEDTSVSADAASGAGLVAVPSDGAAVVMLAGKETVERLGLQPKARLVGIHGSGEDPALAELAAARAVERVLNELQMGASEMNRWELMESSAVVTLALEAELGLDAASVNVLGGALARGLPLGGCDAIVRLGHLLAGLEREWLRYGLLASASDLGQGLAAVVDREIYF